ncbi:MAG: hypothetical protein AB7E32_15175 [Desulfovibrio sp.]
MATLLLCAISAAAPAGAESPPYEDNYGGIWRTGWEDVMFSMDYEGGARGAYGAQKNGRFIGTVRVQRLTAAWAADQGEERCAEPRWGSLYWGEVVMDFSDDAGKLSGVWGACGKTPDKRFTGRRLSLLEMNAEIRMPEGKPLPEAPSAVPQASQPVATPVEQPATDIVVDPGPDSPPADFPKLPAEFKTGSGHPDPAAMLLPDTALDDAVLGKRWEVDALVDRCPEKALPVGWVYRMAYASYLPLNEEGPLLDMRVYTGQEPALNMLETAGQESLSGGAAAPDVAPVAYQGQEDGRAVIWFRTGKALVRVSAPNAGLAEQLAKLAQQAR